MQFASRGGPENVPGPEIPHCSRCPLSPSNLSNPQVVRDVPESHLIDPKTSRYVQTPTGHVNSIRTRHVTSFKETRPCPSPNNRSSVLNRPAKPLESYRTAGMLHHHHCAQLHEPSDLPGCPFSVVSTGQGESRRAA